MAKLSMATKSHEHDKSLVVYEYGLSEARPSIWIFEMFLNFFDFLKKLDLEYIEF